MIIMSTIPRHRGAIIGLIIMNETLNASVMVGPNPSGWDYCQ